MSDNDKNWDEIRKSIMGFGGEHSSHKIYYPELQKRLDELTRFKNLVDNVNDILIQANIDTGKIIDVNKSASILLQYSRLEIIDSDISSIIDNDVIDRIKSLSAFADINIFSNLINTELKTKLGFKIPVEMSYYPGKINDKKYILFIARNIQDRIESEQKLKQSEANFKMVFDNITDGIIIHNNIGEMIEVNYKMLEMFGLDRSTLHQFSVYDLSYRDQDSSILKKYFEDAKHGATPTFEWKAISPYYDQYFWIEVKMRRIYWNDQVLILTLIKDISERKQFENKLKDANIELETMNNELEKNNTSLEIRVKERTLELENEISERKNIEEHLIVTQKELYDSLKKEKVLNDLKSRFISMASHEYRTPLTVVQNNLYLLEQYFKRNDFDNFKKSIDMIDHSVQLMSKLLNDALTVEDNKSNRYSIMIEPLEVIEFTKSLLINSFNDKDLKRITLISSLDKLIINIDKELYKRIILNLLSNALKFSHPDKNIELELIEKSNSFDIKVIDNGIGMPNDEMKYLFEPFYRFSNVGTIQGTGLGLAIVKDSVDLLHGKINIESKLNQGTRIYLSFKK